MCADAYKQGVRFAKWRAVLKIDEATGCPKDYGLIGVQENAWGLARYAAICQENGLVSIVEPQILSDSPHSVATC